MHRQEDIEKIHNIIKEVYPSTNMGDFGLKEMLCCNVAEWMKKNMINKACAWLEQNFSSNEELSKSFVTDFRKAMEE